MFRPGFRYKLKDPARYDDEDYGEGFDHVAVPAQGMDGMFITDCWIVNSQNDVHPGYNASPVPVRFDDVEEASGEVVECEWPERQPIHGFR